jgi:hypothetical protein
VSGLITAFGCPPGISWLIPTTKKKKFVVEKEYKVLTRNTK